MADLLRQLGAAVECSDRIVRELQEPGGEILAAIVETFGPEFLTEEGELDRDRLGKRVFGDDAARLALGNLIHPSVYRELVARMERHRAHGVEVIVLDIPLLLEGRKTGKGSGALLPFDAICVVYASPETQLERILARDGLAADQGRARIASQLSIDEKADLADVVIDNSGDWERTAEQVRKLYVEWASAARSGSPR